LSRAGRRWRLPNTRINLRTRVNLGGGPRHEAGPATRASLPRPPGAPGANRGSGNHREHFLVVLAGFIGAVVMLATIEVQAQVLVGRTIADKTELTAKFCEMPFRAGEYIPVGHPAPEKTVARQWRRGRCDGRTRYRLGHRKKIFALFNKAECVTFFWPYYLGNEPCALIHPEVFFRWFAGQGVHVKLSDRRTFAGHTQGGARPQTAEIIKTFGERCQQVVVNNKQEKADYVVVLDHEGGKGYLRRRNKVAVFNKEGDAIVSRSTRSLGNSVQDGCDAIVADWSVHGAVAAPSAPGNALLPEPLPKPAPETHSAPVVSTAKRDGETPVQATPALVIATEKVAAATGASVGTVSVTSDPDGAEIFIDSVGYGHAPAILKLPHGKHSIQLVRQGYKD
jgi:hypothetical protein